MSMFITSCTIQPTCLTNLVNKPVYKRPLLNDQEQLLQHHTRISGRFRDTSNSFAVSLTWNPSTYFVQLYFPLGSSSHILFRYPATSLPYILCTYRRGGARCNMPHLDKISLCILLISHRMNIASMSGIPLCAQHITDVNVWYGSSHSTYFLSPSC